MEIGDNAVWDACKHTEIQHPLQWSLNSIAITVNQGSFNDCDTAFLFVIDEHGVASEGKQVTFDNGIKSCIPKPASPTSLKFK